MKVVLTFIHFGLSLGAYIIVPTFNLIGLPLSVLLAYGPLHMEVAGLWWGACVGTVASALIQLVVVVYYTDWEKEVERCLHRLISTSPASPDGLASHGSAVTLAEPGAEGALLGPERPLCGLEASLRGLEACWSASEGPAPASEPRQPDRSAYGSLA